MANPQTPFDVACPQCDAEPGAPCTWRDGKPRSVSHSARDCAFDEAGGIGGAGLDDWQNYPGRAAWEAKQRFAVHPTSSFPWITCCRCGAGDHLENPIADGLCAQCTAAGEFLPGDRFYIASSENHKREVLLNEKLTGGVYAGEWQCEVWSESTEPWGEILSEPELRKEAKRIAAAPDVAGEQKAATKPEQAPINNSTERIPCEPAAEWQTCDWCGASNANYPGHEGKLYCDSTCKADHERYPRSGHNDNKNRFVGDIDVIDTVTVHGITMSRARYEERCTQYDLIACASLLEGDLYTRGPSTLATRDLSKPTHRDPWDWDADDALEGTP